MLRFILRRLAIIPLVLLVVNFSGYAYAHLVLPLRAARTPYLLNLPEQEPLFSGYVSYLEAVIRFDLGTVATGQAGRSLAEAIGRAVPASLGLLGIALAVSTLVGLILGLAATRPDPPRRRRWLTVVSTLGLALPSFYVGSLLVLVVFLYVLVRPGQGLLVPIRGFGWDLHLVLPILALMIRPTVQIAQVTSGLIVDELDQPYIRTARSVGNTWSVILRRHVLRNVLASVVLAVAGSLRLLVGELILVEWLFKWPGLGYYFAQTLIPPRASPAMATAISRATFLNPTIVATILTVFAALFLLTDFVVSILVRLIDPRLRVEREEGVGHV